MYADGNATVIHDIHLALQGRGNQGSPSTERGGDFSPAPALLQCSLWRGQATLFFPGYLLIRIIIPEEYPSVCWGIRSKIPCWLRRNTYSFGGGRCHVSLAAGKCRGGAHRPSQFAGWAGGPSQQWTVSWAHKDHPKPT